MISHPTNTLEDRVERLERQVRGLQVLCQAQTSPRTINIICFSQDRDRLQAGFELAEGARASGQEVNLFLRLGGLNSGATQERLIPAERSWMKQVLGWILSRSVPRRPRPPSRPGGAGSSTVNHQTGECDWEELRGIVDEARKRGVKVYECGAGPQMGGAPTDDWVDLELEGWFSLEAMLSLTSRGGATVFL